jgi:hypothetical protein
VYHDVDKVRLSFSITFSRDKQWTLSCLSVLTFFGILS